MLDYSNADFPKETYYIRHPNRIYFSTDFYDGEKYSIMANILNQVVMREDIDGIEMCMV